MRSHIDPACAYFCLFESTIMVAQYTAFVILANSCNGLFFVCLFYCLFVCLLFCLFVYSVCLETGIWSWQTHNSPDVSFSLFKLAPGGETVAHHNHFWNNILLRVALYKSLSSFFWCSIKRRFLQFAVYFSLRRFERERGAVLCFQFVSSPFLNFIDGRFTRSKAFNPRVSFLTFYLFTV